MVPARQKGHHAQTGDRRPAGLDGLKRAVGVLMAGQIGQCAIDDAVEFGPLSFFQRQRLRRFGLRPFRLDRLPTGGGQTYAANKQESAQQPENESDRSPNLPATGSPSRGG